MNDGIRVGFDFLEIDPNIFGLIFIPNYCSFVKICILAYFTVDHLVSMFWHLL